MPRKLAPLPRQTIQVDKQGRITIPDYLREKADIKSDSWIEISAYPDLEKCSGLSIRKAF